MPRFRIINVLAAIGAAAATSAAFAQHDEHQHGDRPAQHAQPHEHGEAGHAAEHSQTHRPSDPYPLATCPVSGKELGAMGDPIIEQYDGREVRFCCSGCVGKFEAASEEYWKKIDEQIAKEQTPYYPLTTCIVSGEPLVEDGEDIAINHVHRNRLVRFCCRGCVTDFLKDPEPTLKKLDAAAIHQQRERYPLQTCVVSGEQLGSMGDPHEVVIAGRLVRLCCAGCEEELRAKPLEHLPALDEAWKRQGMPAPTESVPDAEDGAHGDEEHGRHDDHGDHEHGGG